MSGTILHAFLGSGIVGRGHTSVAAPAALSSIQTLTTLADDNFSDQEWGASP